MIYLRHWPLGFQMQPKCTLIDTGDLKFWNNSSVAWTRETKCHIKGLIEGKILKQDGLQGPPQLDPPMSSDVTYYSPLCTLPQLRWPFAFAQICQALPPQCLCTCCSYCLECSPSRCLHGFLSSSLRSLLQRRFPDEIPSGTFFKLTSLPHPLILLPFPP